MENDRDSGRKLELHEKSMFFIWYLSQLTFARGIKAHIMLNSSQLPVPDIGIIG